MRAAAVLTFILSVALATQARAGSTQAFDTAYRAAMTSYYAALLASGDGDAEATRRHVLLFKARWDAVTRESASGPAWVMDITTGQSPVAEVAARIDDIQQRAASRDMSAVHLDLEGVRVLLRDARARHGVRILDDALTDYHDTMERLTSRVGLRNEIILRAADYDAIQNLADRAQAYWREIEALAGPFQMLPGWPEAVTGTRDDLATLQQSATAQDGEATQAAGAELKAHYHQLIRALSRG